MEWDKAKNELNIRKHGISFDEASEIFNDPNLIEFFDSVHSTEYEARYICYGVTSKYLVLAVVYTDRSGNIRLISARKASSKERGVYYDRLRAIYNSL